MTSYYGGKKSNGHLIPQDLETTGAKKAAHAIVNAVHFVQDPNVNIPNNRKADIVNLAKNAIQTIENVDHIAPNGNFTDQIIHDQVIDRVHENIVSAIQREIIPPVLNNAVVKPLPETKQQLGISAREVELDRQLAMSRAELTKKESQLNMSYQAISEYMKTDKRNSIQLKLLTQQKKTIQAQLNQAKQDIVKLEGEKQALEAQLNIISAERAQAIQERDALSIRLNGDAVTVGVLQQLQNALSELTKVKQSESKLQLDLTQLTAQEQQNQAQIATLDAHVKRLIANEQKLIQDLADAQKILQIDMPMLKQNLQDEQEKLTKKIKEFVALQAENKKIESSKKKVDKRLTTARAQVQLLTHSLAATQTQLTASLSEKAKADSAQRIAEQQSQKDQLVAAEAKLKQTIAERAMQAAQLSEAAEKKAREAAQLSEAAEKNAREAAERLNQQLTQQTVQQ